jgi:4-hydroxybenzoate polyprenyltransferase
MMWGRNTEFALACWLAMSPFIIGYRPEAIFLWVLTWGSALFVATTSLLSYYERFKKVHLADLLVASALILAAYLLPLERSSPVIQNFFTVGFLLLMFAIIPSRASHPPRGWQDLESRAG